MDNVPFHYLKKDRRYYDGKTLSPVVVASFIVGCAMGVVIALMWLA